MDNLPFCVRITIFLWISCICNSSTDFTPIKLAHITFEPAGGADDTLSPIIFIHGITASKEVWRNIPQVVADKTKRRAYAYDIRNHGESEFTDAADFDQSINDVFHFMDSINASKAILLGHSLGGHAVMQAALRKPERVELLIVEDMYARAFSKTTGKLVILFLRTYEKQVRAIPKEFSMREAKKYLIDQTPPNPFFRKSENFLNSLVLRQNPDGGYEPNFNVKALTAGLKNVETGMSELVGQYMGPTYFIAASESPVLVFDDEENIKKHFPNAEMVLFQNATHNLHIGYPDKFADCVIDFVQKNTN